MHDVAAALLAHSRGDSNEGDGASFTLPALTSTATASTTNTTSSTTNSTTTTVTTTRSVAATTSPGTTRARATDATAQGFFEAWVANDAAKLAANGEAAAIAQANGLASSRNRPWNFEQCEGAAGSVYCTWLDAGQRLIVRVRNVEPPPRAVIEIRIEAV